MMIKFYFKDLTYHCREVIVLFCYIDESSPCMICSLVIGGREGTREALHLSAFIRTELACKGVKIVSANSYKVKFGIIKI